MKTRKHAFDKKAIKNKRKKKENTLATKKAPKKKKIPGRFLG